MHVAYYIASESPLQQVQTSPLEVFELLLISDIMMRVVNSISSAFGIYNKYICFDP